MVECTGSITPFGWTKGTDPKLVEKQKEVKEMWGAMDHDAYNRYTIVVRGASVDVYGILRTAPIETEFATLLGTTMPSKMKPSSTYACGPLSGWVVDLVIVLGC